ncbi:MAG: elongation factor P [Proteobacteria bacterium]|nr:elongation factor P [Pseudomonadota bacterium]|tara:strand:- start:165 stop:731 length:567 start_codon:yes stop_codon:yes gene_type:complete
MAKIPATEIRTGNLIVLAGKVHKVLKSYHVHVGGRGGAFMQVETREIETGTKKNERLRSDDKIERAFVETRQMEYLYQDGENYVFMDQKNYEQLSISSDLLDDQAGYLVPNTAVQIDFHNEKPIGVQLPASIVLSIVETEPSLKNATATGSFKPAKVETNITIMVPQFVNEGDKIKVNTDTGEYMERA